MYAALGIFSQAEMLLVLLVLLLGVIFIWKGDELVALMLLIILLIVFILHLQFAIIRPQRGWLVISLQGRFLVGHRKIHLVTLLIGGILGSCGVFVLSVFLGHSMATRAG